MDGKLPMHERKSIESPQAWKQRQRQRDVSAITDGVDPRKIGERNTFLRWTDCDFEIKALDDGLEI